MRIMVQWHPAPPGGSGGYGDDSDSNYSGDGQFGRCVFVAVGRDKDLQAVAVSKVIDAQEMGHLVFDLFMTDGEPFIQVYHQGHDVTEREPTMVRCHCLRCTGSPHALSASCCDSLMRGTLVRLCLCHQAIHRSARSTAFHAAAP